VPHECRRRLDHYGCPLAAGSTTTSRLPSADSTTSSPQRNAGPRASATATRRPGAGGTPRSVQPREIVIVRVCLRGFGADVCAMCRPRASCTKHVQIGIAVRHSLRPAPTHRIAVRLGVSLVVDGSFVRAPSTGSIWPNVSSVRIEPIRQPNLIEGPQRPVFDHRRHPRLTQRGNRWQILEVLRRWCRPTWMQESAAQWTLP